MHIGWMWREKSVDESHLKHHRQAGLVSNGWQEYWELPHETPGSPASASCMSVSRCGSGLVLEWQSSDNKAVVKPGQRWSEDGCWGWSMRCHHGWWKASNNTSQNSTAAGYVGSLGWRFKLPAKMTGALYSASCSGSLVSSLTKAGVCGIKPGQ